MQLHGAFGSDFDPKHGRTSVEWATLKNTLDSPFFSDPTTPKLMPSVQGLQYLMSWFLGASFRACQVGFLYLQGKSRRDLKTVQRYCPPGVHTELSRMLDCMQEFSTVQLRRTHLDLVKGKRVGHRTLNPMPHHLRPLHGLQ